VIPPAKSGAVDVNFTLDPVKGDLLAI